MAPSSNYSTSSGVADGIFRYAYDACNTTQTAFDVFRFFRCESNRSPIRYLPHNNKLRYIRPVRAAHSFQKQFIGHRFRVGGSKK